MSPKAADLPLGRVLAALLLQVVGYAALLVLFPHSSPTGLVDSLSAVSAVVLIPLAIPAIPATVLTIVLGVLLGAVWVPPESLPAILLTRGDVLFFASALVVAVAAAWADERTSSVR